MVNFDVNDIIGAFNWTNMKSFILDISVCLNNAAYSFKF
jgi:hypothetical protein